jgi:ribosomal protein L11 methyltransferase
VSWLQLRLDARRQDAGELEDQLLASGSVAVTLEDNADQPVLEPGVGKTPLWDQIRLTGLYPADTNMDQVLEIIGSNLLGGCNHRVEILEDKDWEREWMQRYQPMQFGERLWVCPSWLEPPDPSAINLLLDPGLAFGTGTHPTTALCLAELDALGPSGMTVVDYGCGSGILAVATLKLGATRALGIDHDPQALRATRDNAQRNGVKECDLTVALPGQETGQPFADSSDLVIANILAGPLIALSDTLLSFMKPGATLMLSGLLSSQAEEISTHYAADIALHIAGELDGWVCLRGRKS